MELQATVQRSAYKQYLQGLLGRWSEYRWLHSFLGRTGAQPATCVTILDISNHHIQSRILSAAGPELDFAIREQTVDQKTKLIVVAYTKQEDVDRQIIDQIALAI